MKLRMVKEQPLKHGNITIELLPSLYKILLKIHVINSNNWRKVYRYDK